jgi:hypothetical protein
MLNGLELYEYDGTILSGNNLVYVESTKLWIRVCDIILAKPYNGPHQNVLYHITTNSGILYIMVKNIVILWKHQMKVLLVGLLLINIRLN